MMTTAHIILERSHHSIPWGLRLNGGSEFGQPITFSNVLELGLANQAGLQDGDRLKSINGITVDHSWTHKKAHDAFITAGNYVRITIMRWPEPQQQSQRTSTNRTITLINANAPVIGATPTHATTSHSQSTQKNANSNAALYQKPSKTTPHIHFSRANPSTSGAFPLQMTSPDLSCFPSSPPHLPNTAPRCGTSTALSPPTCSANASTIKNIRLVQGSGARLISNDVVGVGANGFEQGPICQTCRVQIRGPYLAALDNLCFCPGHFRCEICHTDLAQSGVRFVRGGNADDINNNVRGPGKFYCETDFRQQIAPKCEACGQPVMEGVRLPPLVSSSANQYEMNQHSQSHVYHTQCFVCSHCRCELADCWFKRGEKGGDDVDEQMDSRLVYCEPCWSDLFALKCERCGGTMEDPFEKVVEHRNKSYHARCFTCFACKVPLGGGKFVVRSDGSIFCRIHAHAAAVFN